MRLDNLRPASGPQHHLTHTYSLGYHQPLKCWMISRYFISDWSFQWCMISENIPKPLITIKIIIQLWNQRNLEENMCNFWSQHYTCQCPNTVSFPSISVDSDNQVSTQYACETTWRVHTLIPGILLFFIHYDFQNKFFMLTSKEFPQDRSLGMFLMILLVESQHQIK